jgi:hypothetical protein
MDDYRFPKSALNINLKDKEVWETEEKEECALRPEQAVMLIL